MKFNPRLKKDMEKYKDYVIVVEGKKGASALKKLGFDKVYDIHKTGVRIRDVVDEIVKSLERKDRMCILTDLDKKGKQLYFLLKKEFDERGVKLDSSLRGLLIKSRLKHVEEIGDFIGKVAKI